MFKIRLTGNSTVPESSGEVVLNICSRRGALPLRLFSEIVTKCYYEEYKLSSWAKKEIFTNQLLLDAEGNSVLVNAKGKVDSRVQAAIFKMEMTHGRENEDVDE